MTDTRAGLDRAGVLLARALPVLLPVAIYLALVAFQIQSHPREDYDEYIFMDVGHQIVATGLPIRTYQSIPATFFFDHTPLYVYLVAALTAIGGPSLTLVRSVTLAFGLVSVVGVYAVGRAVRGPVAGLVGALVLATNPFFATYSWFVRMEIPMCAMLVLAMLALVRERFWFAGLAIAAAVLFKEIALAFWLAAVVFVAARRGVRSAIAVALPSALGLIAWFAYAASLDLTRLEVTIRRWLGSAAGGVPDPRLKIRWQAWTDLLVNRIIGPVEVAATGAAIPFAALGRRAIPPIAAVPIAYVIVAVASSYLIKLKEPRYVIAIIPMLALSVALTVDWDSTWSRIRGRAVAA